MKQTIRNIFHCIDRHLLAITLTALFFLSLSIFSSWWIKWVNALWVTPVMSKLVGSEIWIILILAFSTALYYVRLFSKVEKYRCSRLWIAVLYAAVYLISYSCGEWNYSYIQIRNIRFACTHLTLVPCILEGGLLLKCYIRRKLKDKKGRINSLEYETTKLTRDNDLYNRLPANETILKIIQDNFCNEHSVAVGITGGWGSGKTTLLNYLKEELEKKQKSMTVINFYPWRYETSEKLLKSFFIQLEKVLKKHILDLSNLFDEYVAELIDSKAGNYIKLLNHLRGQGSVYDRISGKLHASQHETIVFIDDLDRLEADEIMTVFKLIRNTADFPYIQFIAAYEKSYVINALKNKGIENPDKYLEKIFNVDIVLPKFEDRIICHEVESRIQKIVDDVWEKEHDKAERVKEMVYYFSLQNGSYHEYLIPAVLNTMRDVIRFRNAFYISAKMYKDSGTQYEIDFQDLFYLELIRYRYLGIYNTLRNSPLKLLELNSLTLSQKGKNSTKTTNNHAGVAETLMDRMFSNHSQSSKAIRNIRSYNKYFLYRLDSGILTESELLELQTLDEESLLNKAENLYIDKEPHEFEHQLLEMLNNSLSEISEYEIPCRLIHLLSKTKNDSLREEISNVCVFHLNDFPSMKPDCLGKFLDLFNCIDFRPDSNTRFNTTGFLMTLLFTSNIRSKVNIHDDELHILQEIVTLFLKKTVWPNIITPGISSILYDENLQEKSLLLPSADLRDIQLNYFLTYEDKLSESGRTLFYNCIKTTDPITKKTTLRDEALSAMRIYIGNHPEDYFASFLRTNQSSNPEYMTIYPEPFCNAIFKDWKNFESFLKKNHDKPGWKKINNFWQLFKYNRYNELTFSDQGNVVDKINNNFKDEIKQLYQLKKIDKEIQTGKYNVIDVKKKLDAIPLNLTFKNMLYKSIKA